MIFQPKSIAKYIYYCLIIQFSTNNDYLCTMVKQQTEIPTKHDTSTVSVVLCTYNGEKYLREQLDSVVNQTYPLHEIIIQDDGSTENTLQIANEYADQHDNIIVRTNSHEHGINSNFFSAIRSSTGDFIAICDQDDIWERDKIARQMAAIDDALMCTCHSKAFSEDGSFAHFDCRKPNYGLLRLLFCNEIPGHTMLINRRLLDLLPPQNECEVMYGIRMYDFILAITAAAHESIMFVDEVLVHHRRYVDAATYTAYSGSLHTLSNAMKIVAWSLTHYKAMKKATAERHTALKDYLQHLTPQTGVCAEGIKFMELMLSHRFIDFTRLEIMCLKHRSEIFHTPGKDPSNILRALLFPFTSLYYSHFLLNKSEK